MNRAPMAPRLPLATLGDASRPSSPVDYEKALLPPSSSIQRHPRHGDFIVRRRPKAADSDEVVFDLTLKGRDGTITQASHSMVVCNCDPLHRGRATLGYGEIDLPAAMQGKGIGGVYSAVAAMAGCELGVERMVADNVVTRPMQALCEKLRMDPARYDGSFELDPISLLHSSLARCAAKGWTPVQA